MTLKLRILGLPFIAALLLSALVGPAAQAEFHSSVDHTITEGSQVGSHVFTAGAGFGNITCNNVKFGGTVSSKTVSSETILVPAMTCTDSVADRVVHTTAGEYTYTTPKTSTGEAEVHILKTITIHITGGGGLGTCHCEIPPQTLGGNVHHPLGGTSGVEITTNSTGVDSVVSGGFFNCGISNGAHSNGTYSGVSIKKGFTTEGAAVEVKVTP